MNNETWFIQKQGIDVQQLGDELVLTDTPKKNDPRAEPNGAAYLGIVRWAPYRSGYGACDKRQVFLSPTDGTSPMTFSRR